MRLLEILKKNREPSKTIKDKIQNVTIKLLILSLLIIGVVSCVLNYWTLYRAMRDSLQTTAQVAAGQVNYHLTATINSVEVIGSIPQLTDASISDTDKQALLDEYAEHFGWLYMSMTDANGTGMGNASFQVSNEDYFKQAIQGETVITDPFYSNDTGGLVVIIAAPLWENGDFNSKICGTVIATLDARLLSEIVADIKVSKNGGAYIINKDGTEIGAEDYSFVEQGWNSIEAAKTDASFRALAKYEAKMIQGESGFATYLFMGTPKYMGYVPVGINGWSLSVTAPIADFMTGTIWSIILTIVVLSIMCIVGRRIAHKLGNSIGNAVRICSDRLELLSQGDLATEVQELDTQDETKILENSTRAIVETQQTIIGDINYLLGEMSDGNFAIVTQIGEDAYVGAYREILTSIRTLRDSMIETLQSVIDSSDQVDAGAEQLAGAAQDLAEGATNQASTVEELLATVTDVADQVERNNEVTIAANSRVKEIEEVAVESERMMHTLTGDMESIKQTSDEINMIITEIEEIASQTNLLSLNASIEAARAGEAGRGFAVVADQIGKLAEQSARSAVNTRHLIEASIQAIDKGNEATGITAEHIGQVMSGLEEIVNLIAAIQEASDSQTTAIEQIKEGVEVISEVVANNSAAAEETSATSEELSAQAQTMQTLVQQFKLK